MNTVNRITALFENSGKSKRSILLELEFSPTALSEWNRGKSKPTVEAIIKLSQYFNVSTDYLLGLTDELTPLKKAVPVERLESNAAAIEVVTDYLTDSNGIDWIEKLYKEFDEKQKLFVLTWIISYALSQDKEIKKILGI